MHWSILHGSKGDDDNPQLNECTIRLLMKAKIKISDTMMEASVKITAAASIFYNNAYALNL